MNTLSAPIVPSTRSRPIDAHHDGRAASRTHHEREADRIRGIPLHPSGAARRGEGLHALIVDEPAEDLRVLCDQLEESGYGVELAGGGEVALTQARRDPPDIVLLAAGRPGIDGFALARQFKADPQLSHVPIVFMTARTDSDYLVAALESGGADVVVRPIRAREVLARMRVQMESARLARQARNALDAFGYASITVRASDGRLMWQTPLARELLLRYFGTTAPHTPRAILEWLRSHLHEAQREIEPPKLVSELGARRLTVRLHQDTGDDGDWLIVMREASDEAVIASMSLAFRLTAREAECLYWVAKGKINRDIADIVGASPATVKKHLERVFVKLGVETRTAAAAMAMNRIRQLHPQFEG